MKLKSILFSVLAVFTAVALKADTLYWQVADNSMGDFTYATLYAVPTANAGQAGTEITSVLADGVDLASVNEGTKVSPVLTDITGYGSTYSFYVEVTNYAGESRSLNQNYPWTYNELLSNGYISTGSSMSVPTAIASGSALNGGSVPEPTSGMLLLIGGSLLALRRRRR